MSDQLTEQHGQSDAATQNPSDATELSLLDILQSATLAAGQHQQLRDLTFHCFKQCHSDIHQLNETASGKLAINDRCLDRCVAERQQVVQYVRRWLEGS